MNAGEFVSIVGEKAIGCRVITEEIGAYPGGPATIVAVFPDPMAQEIVCTVKHDTWRCENHPDGEIGVSDFEEFLPIPKEDEAKAI